MLSPWLAADEVRVSHGGFHTLYDEKKKYMYKEDLALNNLQGLICHKNQSISQCKLFNVNILILVLRLNER